MDGVGAVRVDGDVPGFGPLGAPLDCAAARCRHQQGDQVFPVGDPQGLDHLFGVPGLIVLEQGPLQGLALGGLFHKHRLEGIGVQAGVEHAGADGAGGRIEVLDLLGPHVVFVQVLGQIDRVLQGAAGWLDIR